MPPEIDPATVPQPKTVKEIIREVQVPVFKEFDAETQLKIGQALLTAYQKGWTECAEFFKAQEAAKTPPKKGMWS